MRSMVAYIWRSRSGPGRGHTGPDLSPGPRGGPSRYLGVGPGNWSGVTWLLEGESGSWVTCPASTVTRWSHSSRLGAPSSALATSRYLPGARSENSYRSPSRNGRERFTDFVASSSPVSVTRTLMSHTRGFTPGHSSGPPTLPLVGCCAWLAPAASVPADAVRPSWWMAVLS